MILEMRPDAPEDMLTTTMERPPEMNVSLRGVRPNIVQSIRAFRVSDLQEAAHAASQHFLYANLGNAQSKQDVLDLIAQQFMFPTHFGKNFDKEAREQLLDIFRDASDFWGDRKIPFRCFYSFL